MTSLNAVAWPMRIFVFSIVSIVLIFIVDYKYLFLPIHGTLLFFYTTAVLSLSIWISSSIVQTLLKESKPIDFTKPDEREVLGQALAIAKCFISKEPNIPPEQQQSNGKILVRQDEVDVAKFQDPKRESSIDDRISDFVGDIQARFLNNWYSQISENKVFLEESEKLLEEVVRRFLQVVVQIDHKKLVHAIFVVFLKHLKEFKKTLKRSEKNGLGVEDCFRYAHVASQSEEEFQHYVHELTTKVLKQFVSSELWNSLLWRTLVSILSKKLTTNILTYVSQPGFINYKIVYNCVSIEKKQLLDAEGKAYISLSDVNFSSTQTPKPRNKFLLKKDMLKPNSECPDEASTPKISPKKLLPLKETRVSDEVDCAIIAEKIDENVTDTVLKEDSFVKEEKPTRTVSEPVKIYESSTHNTWRNSSDLDSISLGEDLLAFDDINDADSQIQSFIEQKLWKDSTDTQDSDDKDKHSIWNIPENWFGEEAQDVELKDASPNIHTAAQMIENVTDNTIHNMKEFQQMTVNTMNSVVKPISQATSNAKHKIGDFQDEAAGVMEGIFDFGMAGLRKGLRLSGLQENLNDLTQKSKLEIHKFQKSIDAKACDVLKNIEHSQMFEPFEQKSHKPPKLTKLSHINSDDVVKLEERTSSNESDENIWLNPLNTTKESPSFDGQILLEKTPLTPKSFVLDVARRLSKDLQNNTEIPRIAMESQDSTHVSPDLEYEDTTDLATTTAKLRSLLQQRTSESNITTPALSPMPQDEHIKVVTPLEPADLVDVDGVMPSLYKFYNKTATGLQNTFNTIKTALPGQEKTPDATNVENIGDWTFEYEKSNPKDFQSKMEKLLHERRDYCSIDPAYDYLEILDQNDGTWTKSAIPFEDELEDFVQIPITKALLDILCELINDTNSPLTREPVIRSLLLIIGLKTEESLENMAERIVKNIKNLIGKLPQNNSDAPISMQLQEMVKVVFANMPAIVPMCVGEEATDHGLRLLLKMLQSPKINLDLALQLFEILSMQLIQANNLMSPAYSA